MQRFAYSRNGNGPDDEHCPLRIAIPSVSTTSDHHVQYHVHVVNTRTQQVWRVAHRYSEFRALHDALLTTFATAEHPCPGCQNYEKAIKAFEFPPKHMFTSASTVVINYRKRALRAFLALLASHTFTNAPKCPVCQQLPFTGVRDFLVTDKLEAAPGSPQAVDSEAIRESLDIKDFTHSVPVGELKAVNSEGRFIKPEEVQAAKEARARAKAKAELAKKKLQRQQQKQQQQQQQQEQQNHPDPVIDSPVKTQSTTTVVIEPKTLQPSESLGSTVSSDSVPMQAPATGIKPSACRDSIDNEFGSLNMDFMETTPVPTASTD